MRYVNPTKHVLKFPLDFGSGYNEIVVLNPEEEIDIPDNITQDILDQLAPHLKPANQLTRKKRTSK